VDYCVALFDFDTSYLDIERLIRLDHTPEKTPDFEIDENAKLHPFDYHARQLPDLHACIRRQRDDSDDSLQKMAARFFWNLGVTSLQAAF
jgi:hypothetical protein